MRLPLMRIAPASFTCPYTRIVAPVRRSPPFAAWQYPLELMDFDGLTNAGWLAFLTELGIAHKRIFGRTLALTDELGELHACQALQLERAVAGMAGYDALDREGGKVQIKSRAPRKGSHVNPVGRVGRIHGWDFDYALLVLLDSDYRLEAIYRAERPVLEELQAKVHNPKVGIGVRAFIKCASRIDLAPGAGPTESGAPKPVESARRDGSIAPDDPAQLAVGSTEPVAYRLDSLRGRVQHKFKMSGDASWDIDQLVRALEEADDEFADEGLDPAPTIRASRLRGDRKHMVAYAKFWKFPWLRK